MLKEIREVSVREFPRIILTCRDSVELQMARHFCVLKVEPMDDNQMKEFFHNWFQNDSSKAETLVSWLYDESRERMREVCRTPIMASIIAGLHENSVPLPETKTELYERRMDLLLEKWSAVKNVRVTRRVSAKTRKHFLCDLAYGMHLAHRRVFSKHDATSV